MKKLIGLFVVLSLLTGSTIQTVSAKSHAKQMCEKKGLKAGSDRFKKCVSKNKKMMKEKKMKEKKAHKKHRKEYRKDQRK